MTRFDTRSFPPGSLRDPGAGAFRIGPGRNDRGAILVIALLVLLALTGIGVVAMQAASNDLNLAGNLRVAQVARNISTAGVEGTLAFAAMNPSAYNQFVAASGGKVRMEDLSASFFDMAINGTGSFGWDAASMSGASWTSSMISSTTTHRAPGFGLGEYCFRRYIATTDGSYRLPTGASDAATLTIDRNAQARSMTALFVGPMACP